MPRGGLRRHVHCGRADKPAPAREAEGANAATESHTPGAAAAPDLSVGAGDGDKAVPRTYDGTAGQSVGSSGKQPASILSTLPQLVSVSGGISLEGAELRRKGINGSHRFEETSLFDRFPRTLSCLVIGLAGTNTMQLCAVSMLA